MKQGFAVLGLFGQSGQKEKSSLTIRKLCYVKHKHDHNMGFFSWIKSYVLIHVIKHDMDADSNVNYRRKIGPWTKHKKGLYRVMLIDIVTKINLTS